MHNPFLKLLDHIAPVETGHSLEFLLEREMLASEIRRVRLLGIGFSVFALTYVLAMTFGDSILGPLLHHQTWMPLAVILLVVLYEGIVYYFLKNLQKSQRRLPLIGRYGNALVEISMPSLAIIVIINTSTPAFGLESPPSYIFFIFIILSILRMDFGLALFTGIVAAIEYGLLTWFYLPALLQGQSAQWTMILPYGIRSISAAVSGLAAAFVARELRQRFRNSIDILEERNRMYNVFGQFVSPQVREKLLDQHFDQEGEIRQVCLMFLDIRGFTRFSEGRSPQEVVQFLNTLFEFMVESVTKQQGIINKFLGDGFMAVFGAPLSDDHHIVHAVDAALEILALLDQLNATGAIPPTRIGIGLHAGEAVTGAIGSLQRKEYTIIGDTVNLAARLEELNKTYNSRLLISENVWHGLQQHQSGIPAENLGEITIRGHSKPLQIYRLD